MILAGTAGFSLPAFAAMLGLFALEEAAVDAFRLIASRPPPIYRIFTLLFVPTAAILAASGAYALGVALRSHRLARRMALSAGLASGIAFLAVDLGMEALGWQVGGPGAAERATMITVLAVSCCGAALAGGSVVGLHLTRHTAPRTPDSERVGNTPANTDPSILVQEGQGS
jgi:hypothetical protein